MKIFARIEVFREDTLFVALAPELNVSSFGETIEEAKDSIKEALEAFFEECDRMGTLEDVLEESGFLRRNGNWQARRPVAEAALALAV